MTLSNGIEMVREMASKDYDWSVLFPPPNWNDIRTTKVANSMIEVFSTELLLLPIAFRNTVAGSGRNLSRFR
jgi:hypothetical protein